MPRIFGLVLSTDDLPFFQTFGHLGAGTVGNNTSGNFAAGSVTMPWDGELFVNYTMSATWYGYQMAAIHLWSSSPVPTTSSYINRIAGRGSVRVQVPVYAYWASLLKGQVVTLNMTCSTGGGGPSVNFEIMASHPRAVRLGA